MKLTSMAIFLLATALPASGADLTGTWKLGYAGPKGSGPKTVGSIVLELKTAADAVTGTAHIGAWPGDAPIADVKVDGDGITFTATGRLGSTTGIAFLRRKQPAKLRLNPQQLEEISRHGHAAEPLRFTLAAEQIVADAVKSEVTGYICKRPVLRAHIQQIIHLGSLPRETASIMVGDPDQPLRFVKR